MWKSRVKEQKRYNHNIEIRKKVTLFFKAGERKNDSLACEWAILVLLTMIAGNASRDLIGIFRLWKNVLQSRSLIQIRLKLIR
ncbi:MAG: hypothetical protein SWO11_07970 [Thermodesulfobacteriota bacterium]|nr:hypothetical protein [Thermodesulfobacteriota bacterium]